MTALAQSFQGGFIAWHPGVGAGIDGAHEVHGSIGAKWDALGRADFGFPTTDELTPPPEDGVLFPVPSRGRYNHFRATMAGTPESSIYWHPDVAGAPTEVYGEVRAKWAAEGWERSVVGYPCVRGARSKRSWSHPGFSERGNRVGRQLVGSTGMSASSGGRDR